MNELGCSTITFRNRTLSDALGEITGLGFTGVDLGGLPGVCDHVPHPPGPHADRIADAVLEAGVDVWTINVDPGPLNDPELAEQVLAHRISELAVLAGSLDAALIIPCGAGARAPFADDDEHDLALLARRVRLASATAAEQGVRLLVEGLHHHRFCHSAQRLRRLLELIPEAVGLVYDVSHIVAGGIDEVALARELGERVAHVHLRDAAPGDINLSIGRGHVDFAGVIGALTEHGYTGRYVLELETHDVAEEDRATAAGRARDAITALLPT